MRPEPSRTIQSRPRARPEPPAVPQARPSARVRPASTENPVPFSPDDLGALFQGDGFTLWHYRTADTRAAVAAPGYFAPVAGSMFPGDLIILQAADAMALLPVR